jgi:hypothetical protein
MNGMKINGKWFNANCKLKQQFNVFADNDLSMPGKLQINQGKRPEESGELWLPSDLLHSQENAGYSSLVSR